MLKKNILLILLISFCLQNAFSRSEQDLINAGSPLYDEICFISSESGIANFADNEPISIQEAKVYLSEIDVSTLSDGAKKSYEEIMAFFEEGNLGFKSDLLNFGVETQINTSLFYKTNEEVDWVYDRFERKPFLSIPVCLSVSDFISMRMELAVAQNKNASLQDDNYSNIPYKADLFDINFPDIGYFSSGKMLGKKTGINFRIGKGSRNVGRSLSGSVIQSDHLTGISYAELNLFSPSIRYNANISEFGVDRYYYTHQLDLRFFKKFTFTVIESMFVNAPLELRFMNPFTIYHGMTPWRDYDGTKYDSESHTCAYLGLKFQYVPVSNLRLYGLYAMTQFQTAYERENWPNDTTPNGIGLQGGAEYFKAFKDGRFQFVLEGSYTDPYLYIKESPNWSLVHTFAENMGDVENPFYEWIGSPNGPDTVSAEAKIGYKVPQKYAVDLIYLFMAKGEMSSDNVFKNWTDSTTGKYAWGGVYTHNGVEENLDKTDWAYPDSSLQGKDEAKRRQNLVTPSGIPEYVNRLSVRASYYLKDNICVLVQPSLVFIQNLNHNTEKNAFGFEMVASCSIKLF